MAQARELLHAKGYEEHNRLLYVAMTRAKDRLVIAPYRTNGNETRQEAWCEMIRHGLVAKAGGLERDEAPYGEIAVWREGSPLARPLAAEADVPPLDPIAVPDWLTTMRSAGAGALAPDPPLERARRRRPHDAARRRALCA